MRANEQGNQQRSEPIPGNWKASTASEISADIVSRRFFLSFPGYHPVRNHKD